MTFLERGFKTNFFLNLVKERLLALPEEERLQALEEITASFPFESFSLESLGRQLSSTLLGTDDQRPPVLVTVSTPTSARESAMLSQVRHALVGASIPHVLSPATQDPRVLLTVDSCPDSLADAIKALEVQTVELDWLPSKTYGPQDTIELEPSEHGNRAQRRAWKKLNRNKGKWQ